MVDSSSRSGEACAGLLLAAGAGTRLGGPKAHLTLAGESLARRGVRLLTEAGCRPVHVVVQAPLPADIPPGLAISVENPAWKSGMASSLRAGLASLVPTAAGACAVALVDQPFVLPEAVRRLIAAWEAGAIAVCATYDGRMRNPVLLDRSVWDDVSRAATGDQGARGWLRTHREMVTAVPCDDIGAPFDIDTSDDLARAEAQLERQRSTRTTPPSS